MHGNFMKERQTEKNLNEGIPSEKTQITIRAKHFSKNKVFV